MQPLLLSYPKAGKDQLEAFCGLSQEGPCQGPAGLDLAPVLLLEETCGQPTTLQLRSQVPEPDGQQDLDARAVEDRQEKGHSLILSPYS